MVKQPFDTLKSFDWALNGKLKLSYNNDPMLLGENDFQLLQNMRYTDSGIKGIRGMTKRNALVSSYPYVVTGTHFTKSLAADESNILCQISDATTNSKLIYSTDYQPITFTDLITLNNNNKCYFSKAPLGSIAICNSNTNYVWGGQYMPIAKFINYNPDGTWKKDYTDVVTVKINDATSMATLTRVGTSGIDANTMLLLHLENNITDSSPTTAHTVTNNSVTFVDSTGPFGYYGVFNGTTAYLTIPDDPDLDLSGGIWTIDAIIRPTSLTAENPIYYQNTTADADSFKLFITTTGALTLHIKTTAGGTVLSLATNTGVIVANGLYHIAAVENGSNYYLFVNGVLQATVSDADRPANYTGLVQIGKDATIFFTGHMDEIRVSNSARWTKNFEYPVSPYGSTAKTYVTIGSIRPLSQVHFYPSTTAYNTATSSVSVYEWNGSAWAQVTVSSDTTSIAGITLSTAGTITFTSTVSTSKPTSLYNNVLYYYRFEFSGIDDGTQVYYVSCQAPCQSLKDLWDGVPVMLTSGLYYTTKYDDYTFNLVQDTIDTADETTYMDLIGMTSSNYVYLGFASRMMGLMIHINPTNGNTAANTVLSIDYWTGLAWTSVGILQDGTSVGGISLAQSGLVTWANPSEVSERITTLNNSTDWNYYRLSVSQTLTNVDSHVYVYYVGGISAPVTIHPYAFPVYWQDRLWLCGEVNRDTNKAISSATGTVSIWNGNDSAELYFGSSENLVAGSTLFTRYGSTLYENMIIFKKNAIYLVDGTSPDNYITYEIADNVGCVSPYTLAKCDHGYEVAQGLTRHVLIWQSASGIMMFDSNTIIDISQDIKSLFDPADADSINLSIADTFYGFFDDTNKEYHWLCATGSNTTLNKEYVYDVTRKRWFEIVRGAKYLRSGWKLIDNKGNIRTYAGTDDGYIEQLEYGTDFDGVDIAYKFRLGDYPIAKSLMYESELCYLKIAGKVKNTTSNSIAITHYADGQTAGTTIAPLSQAKTGTRLYGFSKGDVRHISLMATLHSLEFSITTDNEIIGFEPLMVSGLYRLIRENLE